jgi:hypothetical protein
VLHPDHSYGGCVASEQENLCGHGLSTAADQRPTLPNSGCCYTHIHALLGMFYRGLTAVVLDCVISLLGKPNAEYSRLAV